MKISTIALIACTLSLTACESDTIPYALEQGLKQGGILLRAEKIELYLKRPGLDPKTKRLLRLTQKILIFAKDNLGMKIGKSYKTYFDLKRSYLTQIVMAAYPDRLESYLFEFPVLGKVPYKGYFDEEDAIKLENKLKSQGLDTYRREVDAFSSLGWFPDPVLNTMLENEHQLTELLFHELTHLNFYFEGEGDFNEAFASYFGNRAALKMIENMPEAFDDPGKSKELLVQRQKREELVSKKVREALDYGKKFYAQSPSQDRQIFFDWLKTHFSEGGQNTKLAALSWNNALLLSLSTYYDRVPSIEAYGIKKSFDEKTYLKFVIETGPKAIPEILAGPTQ